MENSLGPRLGDATSPLFSRVSRDCLGQFFDPVKADIRIVTGQPFNLGSCLLPALSLIAEDSTSVMVDRGAWIENEDRFEIPEKPIRVRRFGRGIEKISQHPFEDRLSG